MNQLTKIKISRIFLGLWAFSFLFFLAIILFFVVGKDFGILALEEEVLKIILYSGLVFAVLCQLFSVITIFFNYKNWVLYILFILNIFPLIYIFIGYIFLTDEGLFIKF